MSYELIIAIFGTTYAATFLGLVALGFGPLGVAGGSVAAFIQSAVYGAAVPAGGWFATMTGLGMTGGLHMVAGTAASALAGLAAWFKP
ncbi:hypothetical protein B0T11DRAFT_338567 [Plectosphaerella cucumerina]|uniref:Uncharacterized protein n=1 Tax=Plectosphaerella cucumerina TaxID=40658 RepID=A0A8K0X2V1_9PEZI|nr:hypothetical protein B0T11DRAFT_338567 [Plectosphaerella cucumerina]